MCDKNKNNDNDIYNDSLMALFIFTRKTICFNKDSLFKNC